MPTNLEKLSAVFTLGCFLLTLPASAGILVLQGTGGIQFVDAVSVTVNGKDKVSSLGNQPKTGTPLSKLPAIRLGATLLRDADSGVLAQYEDGKTEYVVPQGLPKNGPSDPAEVWKDAKINYKKAASDKVGTGVAATEFVAFLPGGTQELTRLCMDANALQVVGGKGKAFAAQKQLMSAVVRSYASAPEIAPLQKYVEGAMRSRYEAFESGNVDALNQALEFADLSQAAYPNQPEQTRLRTQLNDRKAWLGRKMAVLNAFAAADQWDEFLVGDHDFERYHPAFPEIGKLHTEALQKSLLFHSATAAMREKQSDYGAAFHEFQLAGSRKPSDSALHEQAMQAWTEYSRRVAMDQQPKRTKLAAGPQSAIERSLYFAQQNKLAGKLDDALKNVQEAEAVLHDAAPNGVTRETLKVLYAKADVLVALQRITDALGALDAYDLLAVEEERAQSDQLRNQLLFNLTNTLGALKTRLQAAWAGENFGLAAQLAEQGLKMRGDDPDLLYYAGMAAVVRRQTEQGRALLARYLRVSDTLDANPAQRAQAVRMSSWVPLAAVPVDGNANWLSGLKLPKGLFYCPISLAFQPHIDHIEASNKLREAFEWDGERLKSVTPSFDKVERGTEKKITFAYDSRMSQVIWAGEDETPAPAAANDPDEVNKRATVLLLNYPGLDPGAVELATGKNPAVVIAGNPFFNPFVWSKVCYFKLTYDDHGRATRAQQLSGPHAPAAGQTLEFEWNGTQLTAIRGKSPNYERTMQYADGRLIGEDIKGEGKPSHIKYLYEGDRLVSAEASTDATLDNRSRKVMFVANSPSTLVK